MEGWFSVALLLAAIWSLEVLLFLASYVSFRRS